MKIYLYRVLNRNQRNTIEAMVRRIAASRIEERNRTLNNETIRLEHLEEQDGFVFCDFVKVRLDHGPGKAGLAEPIMGFDLKDDEGFGEETALIYDTANDYAAIQYNHYGPRAAVIQEYLCQYDISGLNFEFVPKFDDDLQRKIQERTIYRKLELSVASRLLSEDDFDARESLGGAIALSNEYGADNIELTISVNRGRTRHLSPTVNRIIDWVRRRVEQGTHEGVIEKCKLTARAGEFDRSEVLDLLAQRIYLEHPMDSGPDRRFPRLNRFKALELCYRKWVNELNLES